MCVCVCARARAYAELFDAIIDVSVYGAGVYVCMYVCMSGAGIVCGGCGGVCMVRVGVCVCTRVYVCGCEFMAWFVWSVVVCMVCVGVWCVCMYVGVAKKTLCKQLNP